MLKKIVFKVGVVGFAMVIAIHALSYMSIDAFKHIQELQLVFVFAFVVFFTALLILSRNKINHISQVKNALSNISKVLIIISIPLFIYASFNILMLMFKMSGGSPNIIDGEYVLSNRGTILRIIDSNTYEYYKLLQTRYMTGFWTIFYYFPLLAIKNSIKESSKH